MKHFVDPPTIDLYRDKVDFRKSINGLVLVVEQERKDSAFGPALFGQHRLQQKNFQATTKKKTCL